MPLLLALIAGMLAAPVGAGRPRVKCFISGVGHKSLLILLMVVGARVAADPQVWASFTDQWWKGLAVGAGATGTSLWAGRLVLSLRREEDE